MESKTVKWFRGCFKFSVSGFRTVFASTPIKPNSFVSVTSRKRMKQKIKHKPDAHANLCESSVSLWQSNYVSSVPRTKRILCWPPHCHRFRYHGWQGRRRLSTQLHSVGCSVHCHFFVWARGCRLQGKRLGGVSRCRRCHAGYGPIKLPSLHFG